MNCSGATSMSVLKRIPTAHLPMPVSIQRKPGVAVDKLYTIFKDRTLKVIPSYVRKLINSVVQIQGDFKPEYLDDSFLVRKAFELVARNSYGDLFKKVGRQKWTATSRGRITWAISRICFPR